MSRKIRESDVILIYLDLERDIFIYSKTIGFQAFKMKG